MLESFREQEMERNMETDEVRLKMQDAREKELFSAFNWDPVEFRRKTNERYYHEFLENQSMEFENELKKYMDPSLYEFSWETYYKEGPNCYAFAMQLPLNPLTGRPYEIRPRPGEFAHGLHSGIAEKTWQLLCYGSPQEQKNFFTEMMKDDAKALGMSLKEVDKGYKPGEGEWVIALAATDNLHESPQDMPDFHFYRKGEEGNWYHKPGTEPVQNTDAEGKLIFDPGECNRGLYSHFLGYYAVSGQMDGREV